MAHASFTVARFAGITVAFVGVCVRACVSE